MFVVLASIFCFLGFVSSGFLFLFGFALFAVLDFFALRLLELVLGRLILFVWLVTGFFVSLVDLLFWLFFLVR